MHNVLLVVKNIQMQEQIVFMTSIKKQAYKETLRGFRHLAQNEILQP